MRKEKIPLKFHVENNKIIFDEVWVILKGDTLVIDHFLDEDGKDHIIKVYIERQIA